MSEPEYKPRKCAWCGTESPHMLGPVTVFLEQKIPTSLCTYCVESRGTAIEEAAKGCAERGPRNECRKCRYTIEPKYDLCRSCLDDIEP